jgi:DNA-binding transcriptional regulator LsrR (DeoR family)
LKQEISDYENYCIMDPNDMARPSNVPEEKVFVALELLSRGWTLSRAAERLGVHLSTLSRLVSERSPQFLEVRFRRDKLSPEQWSAVKRLLPPDDIQQAVACFTEECTRHTPKVHVFDTGNHGVSKRDWTLRLEQFGREAAPLVRGLLNRSRICGVSWGETLGNLVTGLARLERSPVQGKRGHEFVPVVGHVVEWGPTKASSFTLAQRLDEIVNGDYQHKRSFPEARVADTPGGEGSVELAEIFGGPGSVGKRPWIDRLDMLLTSVGPKDRPLGHHSGTFLKSLGVTHGELRAAVDGDIAGALLAKPGISEADRALIQRILIRWIGIRETQVSECVARAHKLGSPGVLVVAIGASKARSIEQVLSRGLSNHIVCDKDLSDALLRILSQKIGSPASIPVPFRPA